MKIPVVLPCWKSVAIKLIGMCSQTEANEQRRDTRKYMSKLFMLVKRRKYQNTSKW